MLVNLSKMDVHAQLRLSLHLDPSLIFAEKKKMTLTKVSGSTTAGQQEYRAQRPTSHMDNGTTTRTRMKPTNANRARTRGMVSPGNKERKGLRDHR